MPGPTLAEQGLSVDDALVLVGLLYEPFYDSLRGASPADIDRLEAAAGVPLTPDHRELLEIAGASLGPLRIPDWRTFWDFRPRTLVEFLERKPAPERAALRRHNHVPVAHVGEPYGFTDLAEVCLYVDAATGWLRTEDPDREEVHDCLQALLLEWGHRLFDPRMGAPVGRARLAHRPEPHELAAALGPEEQHVGGLLGIYRFYDSGVLIKAQDDVLEVEARRAHHADPGDCAAARLLDAVAALGVFQLDRS